MTCHSLGEKGEKFPLYFEKKYRTLSPIPFIKWGQNPAMINQNPLIFLSFGKRGDKGGYMAQIYGLQSRKGTGLRHEGNF